MKDELPEFLVEHFQIYGILSKGIHELAEDECLKYFNVIKEGIELILDEKVERYEKASKLKKVSAAISEVNRQMKS